MARGRRQRKPAEGVGQRLTLQVTDMGHQGMAFARHEDMVVWVSLAIPGETVVAEVTDVHAHHLEARTVEVLEASPDRVAAPCPYYGECGGCQYQHIGYERQLALKQRVVSEQLRRIGHFADPPVLPTLAAPAPFNYRNHARFTVGKFGDMGQYRTCDFKVDTQAPVVSIATTAAIGVSPFAGGLALVVLALALLPLAARGTMRGPARG